MRLHRCPVVARVGSPARHPFFHFSIFNTKPSFDPKKADRNPHRIGVRETVQVRPRPFLAGKARLNFPNGLAIGVVP